ncbi:MAG: hypothetical protein KJ601_07970 [Nanoarchaeota archaeon]|nr:hypothetical protein [Nanoarchaeota archaeon]MBU1703966.1 hypothetical protein [Nanoarchaeota archaeon]
MKFKKNVEKSFQKVRADIDALKTNSADWTLYLNSCIKEMEQRISRLESKKAKSAKRRS